ncbi:uncharacterized protein LOC126373721 [Pectinophora gossypiella]|uniref:uncharacterized protein LOC126373721 n=1 Tax=Pectinophora gossypiella TaxID=13191 RepID=UPI00214E8DB5|nr:uncharacterized protein LOC126373721 [Pectinophora gossypiella]
MAVQQDKSSSTVSRTRRALSQSDPALLMHVKNQQAQFGKSNVPNMLSALQFDNFVRKSINISKINYLSMAPVDDTTSLVVTPGSQHTQEPSRTSSVVRGKTVEDSADEQFPINVTSLMNEDNYWGCFYPFPELYNDVYSPVVRVRDIKDVAEIVGGVLTRDMVNACLTYLKRTPILGDFVFIKLDLSNKHLVNIEVLQHYKYLVYLDLSANYLTDLTVLSHLLYLQNLSVSFNRLNTVLEYDVPQWFLTEVHYKYNSVKRIRDLTMFWSITILDLSHNNIKGITGLENLHYLRRLDLSFNHIQRLENLNNLRLVWLDVSYNNISSFEFGSQAGLWTLYHLEYLNLNENNLTSMKIFSGCTRVKELHARNNGLSMLLELAVYMRQMRRLAILDLRANPICCTPGYRDVVINTFPLLLSLDAEELDPVIQRRFKMDTTPDVKAFACRRLLRLLYIEQLSRARVSPYVPPADTREVPLVIIVGYEAVGKGTLVRRLANDCSANIEEAVQHTTAMFHFPGHYREVTRKLFDKMLLSGELLTYSELDGESYGLSREEAYVKDGKVKVAAMDLTSALMMQLRGRRPYLILATCSDKNALIKRQRDRKEYRNRMLEARTSVEVPLEKSTLQVLVSGRILVTGILNEILLCLPEEKEESEFVIESQCSLLMDSDAREAVQEYSKGITMLTLMSSGTSSLEEVCKRAYKQTIQNEASLCSLYKESQNTDEYASDINGQNSYQDSKKSGISGANSAKSSKSVTFTSQDAEATAGLIIKEGEIPRNLTGLLIEPANIEKTQEGAHFDQERIKHMTQRSLSKKFPWPIAGHGPPPGRTGSGCSMDPDGDLWLSFLIDTGLLQASDPNIEMSETFQQRRDTKVDDPEYILKQLAYYRMIPSQSFSTNIRDDYEHIHRKCPGLFWDTITMDDPEQAFKKAKRIIKDIVNSQPDFKPMFDINFTMLTKDYPTIKKKIATIANNIAPRRFFF